LDKRANRVWEIGEIDFFIIFRWLLILLVLFLTGYNSAGWSRFTLSYKIAVIYVAFNVVIRFKFFNFLKKDSFLFLIYFFDIIFVSVALYTSGGIDQTFYVFYFLTILMASINSGLKSSIPVAIISSFIYIWITGLSKDLGFSLFRDPSYLMRIPFLFLMAFMSGLWKDIMDRKMKTKEKENKETIKKLKGFYENVINSVTSGIVVINNKGEIILTNPSYNKLIRDGIDAEPILEGIKISQKKRVEFTTSFKEKSGRILTLITSFLKDSGGRINGSIGIVSDITKEKEMETELEHSKHLAYLGKMASFIAHEIRNPLGVIRGMSQLIEMKSNDGIDGYVDKIKENADRIDGIIDDILDIAKREDGKKEIVNIAEVMRDVISSLRENEKYRNSDIKLKVDEEIIVEGDKERLRRVFNNIISNGIEIKGEDAEVRIAIYKEKENGYVDIKDNGPGIPEDKVEKIFEPFFSTKEGGTGLGLAIVKKILTEHKGKIKVFSRLGEGALFRVILPIRKSKGKEKEVQNEGTYSR